MPKPPGTVRSSRLFAKVEFDWWLFDAVIRSLKGGDRARYLDLWALARYEKSELLSAASSSIKYLKHLWRSSAPSAEKTLKRLVAKKVLIAIWPDGRIRVIGCSKKHGLRRNGNCYVKPVEEPSKDGHDVPYSRLEDPDRA